jgi:hypothetical protein
MVLAESPPLVKVKGSLGSAKVLDASWCNRLTFSLPGGGCWCWALAMAVEMMPPF